MLAGVVNIATPSRFRKSSATFLKIYSHIFMIFGVVILVTPKQDEERVVLRFEMFHSILRVE